MPKRRLVFATEARLHRGPDGRFHADLAEAWFERWQPFLGPFDEVVVVARVEDEPREGGRPVEGECVKVAPLPHYRGARELVLRFGAVRRAVRDLSDQPGAVYAGRFPGVISSLVASTLRRSDSPLLAFLVGDPGEVLRSGVAGGIGRILAPLATLVVRRQVRTADAVVYVTERVLQERFPSRPGVPTLARTNAVLGPEAFAPEAKRVAGAATAWRLVAVGSQEQLYKGHHVLISAVALLRARGLDVSADIIGAGARQQYLRELARRQGIEGHVRFLGHLSGAATVREALDDADVFVMPSLTEGMPRALLEAMARGLPCVGSRVGGIPELLDRDYIVRPGDPDELAAALQRILADPAGMNRQGAANLARARQVAANLSEDRFHEFLELLGQRTTQTRAG